MEGTWQKVLSNLTSNECLTSDYFATTTVQNGTAYCAYKVPSIYHAQICCLSEVYRDPQDECTYICPHQTSFPILSCLHTVLGSLDPRKERHASQQTFITSMSGKAVRMLCFDNDGKALPNISYPSLNMSYNDHQPYPPQVLPTNGSQGYTQPTPRPPGRPNFDSSLQEANPSTSAATSQRDVSTSLRSWYYWLVPLTIVSVQILCNG